MFAWFKKIFRPATADWTATKTETGFVVTVPEKTDKPVKVKVTSKPTPTPTITPTSHKPRKVTVKKAPKA